MGDPTASAADPDARVTCHHADQCGACPLIDRPYGDQRDAKAGRVDDALARYGILSRGSVRPVRGAGSVAAYRRRAKLVVTKAPGGGARIGLYRRHDNQHVVDIPDCQVLDPVLSDLVATLRGLASDPPEDLAPILTPSAEGRGVLSGLDVRALAESGGDAQVLITLILAAERAADVDVLREAGRALRSRLPQIAGLAVSLRFSGRHQPSPEFVPLSGATECRDGVGTGEGGAYQLVSHTSFLHVHRDQASAMQDLLSRLVAEVAPGPRRVLDLYGGTGAIALALAAAGHQATLVESYPPAAALAARAAQAQRLEVEVVTGDVASVTRALAAAKSSFDVVIANPPRRGLSPASREAIAALRPRRMLYVACDLHNLSRDLDHLSRLGYELLDLHPIDMLPLTEEVEAVAVLAPAGTPIPAMVYRDEGVLALDKPPHEPCQDQAEYPVSLVGRARPHIDLGGWHTVLPIEANTSGVTMFARDEATAERWRQALQENGRLVYLAAARGVTPAKGAITRDLRGDDGPESARTRYRRLAIGGGHSVLRVVPEKRRRHQIRRHLAAIGHPVLGDARYGHAPTNRYFEEKHGLDRSFLHLVRVEINHPDSGERLIIEAPLPADLRASLVRASDDSVLQFLKNKRALGGEPRPSSRGEGGYGEASPLSERSPLSEVAPASGRRGHPTPAPFSRRGGGAIDLDEAPRTVRGELLMPDDD